MMANYLSWGEIEPFLLSVVAVEAWGLCFFCSRDLMCYRRLTIPEPGVFPYFNIESVSNLDIR